MKPSPIRDSADFDLSAIAHDLRSETAYERDGHTARTLVRDPKLRIVLIAMKAGSRIAEHRSQEPVSIHTLAGNVRIALPTHTVGLPAGALLAIAAAVPHALDAIIESTILLTIAWE